MVNNAADLVRLHMGREAQQDIEHLSSFSQQLPQIAECLSQLSPGTGFADVATACSKQVGISVTDASRIAWTLWNLHVLRRETGANSRELIDLIAQCLKSEAREHWGSISEELIAILDSMTEDHPLLVTKKAQELSLANQCLFSNARLMVDIRPVFDSTGSRILEFVVLHSLLVNYYDGRSNNTILLTLDAADIADLRRQFERADQKIIALKESLRILNWPTRVVGESPMLRIQPGEGEGGEEGGKSRG